MNSRTFLLSIAMVVWFPLAQALAQFGIKAGIGVSDIVFLEEGQSPYLGYEVDFLEHRTPKLTFQVGVFADFRVAERLDFQPELLFITQGLDYDISFLYDDISYQLKISYLHTPCLLRYQLAPNKKWRPALLAGPYASLKLRAVRETEIGRQQEKVVMPNVKSTDFGVVAGIGADFALPTGQMVVDLRTTYSLVNMMDRVEGFVPSYYGPKRAYVRNVSIVLTVGYRFINLKP